MGAGHNVRQFGGPLLLRNMGVCWVLKLMMLNNCLEPQSGALTGFVKETSEALVCQEAVWTCAGFGNS